MQKIHLKLVYNILYFFNVHGLLFKCILFKISLDLGL